MKVEKVAGCGVDVYSTWEVWGSRFIPLFLYPFEEFEAILGQVRPCLKIQTRVQKATLNIPLGELGV